MAYESRRRKSRWGVELTKDYSSDRYQRYDNYDAIHVKAIADIPRDYKGVMGVPITIVNKLGGNQFDIVGEANHGSDNEYDLFKPAINGKLTFKRILVRLKGG